MAADGRKPVGRRQSGPDTCRRRRMTIWQGAALLVLLTPAWLPLTLLLGVRGAPLTARFLLAAAILVWTAGAVWLVVLPPQAVVPLAAVVAAAWVLLTWRARPSAGKRSGRPPGSLGLRSSLRALCDYRFYEKEAARFGPVFKSSQYHRPVLCVVGLERCQRFLREHRERLTSAPLPIDQHITGGLLRYMEPAAHAEYRRRLQACMKARVLAACGPFLAELFARELSALAELSGRSGSGVRPHAHVDRLVFLGLNRVFFGFLPDEPAVGRLARLYRVVDHRRLWRDSARTRRALEEIVDIVRVQAGKWGEGEGATASSFLGQVARDHGGPLTDPVFAENLVYFLHIARCDLTGLCRWLLKMLVDHPDRARGIRTSLGGDPASGTTPADRFVDETLRLRQSEYLYRTAAGPIEFEGFSIPMGWLVRLCIRESHTAAATFERPKEFDPDRFLNATYPPERYQPFGIYEHACIGAAVTKTVGRIFVEELAGGFDVSVVRDGPMELGLHHHGHWAPSRRLAIRLTPRSV
jgi:cytochrome P450